MPKFLAPIDLTKLELLNFKAQNIAGDYVSPGAGDKGLIWHNTSTALFRGWDGTTLQTLTNLLEGVTGTAPIVAGAISAKSQAISITAASGGAAGSMSAAHYSLVNGAASINTASTLVLRDGSGNFAAGTITAALTGTASNAALLNSQAASYYLSRANHTSTQLAATISDFDTQVRTSRLDQMAVPTATVNMNTHTISNVIDPASPQDAATKNYVDGVAAGLDVKLSCRMASTANVTATYNSTGGTSARGQMTAMANTAIDGVTPAANNRVLLKNQSTGAQNGIWVITTLGSGANGVWDRATRFDSDAEVTTGAFTFIEEGTTQASSGWVLTTPNPIIIGGASGTALTFSQFSGAGAYVGGAGMTLTGNTFDVVGTSNRITVAADSIDISTAYVGQATITTLGTITTGTWTGTTIALANGGTASTTAAGAKTVLGFMTRYAVTFGDGSATSYTITHSLGTLDVTVAIVEVSTGNEVFANVTHATTNTLTLAFTVAPASNTLRVVVIG